jgi:hypothetical protein
MKGHTLRCGERFAAPGPLCCRRILGPRRRRFTNAGDRLDIFPEKELGGSVCVAALHEQRAASFIGASNDVVPMPFRAEANVDREGDELTSVLVDGHGRLNGADAAFPRGRSRPREAIRFFLGQRLDESVFDAALDPTRGGRFIGPGGRREGR